MKPSHWYELAGFMGRLFRRHDWQRIVDAVMNAETICWDGDSHQKGTDWEDEFVEAAKGRELSARKDRQQGHDAWVNGLRVQCKSACFKESGRVDISRMRPIKKHGGKRAYHITDYDILALRYDGDYYLVPAVELKNVGDDFLATSIRPGDWESAKDNWGVFGQRQEPRITEQQKEMF